MFLDEEDDESGSALDWANPVSSARAADRPKLDFSAYGEPVKAKPKAALDFSSFGDPVQVDVPLPRSRPANLGQPPVEAAELPPTAVQPGEAVPLPRARPAEAPPRPEQPLQPAFLDDAPARTGGSILDTALGADAGMLSGDEAYAHGQERVAAAEQALLAARREREAAKARLDGINTDPSEPARVDMRNVRKALARAETREQQATAALSAAKRAPLPTQGSARNLGETVLRTAAQSGADVLSNLRGIAELSPHPQEADDPALADTRRRSGEVLRRGTEAIDAAVERGARPDPTRDDEFGTQLTAGATSMGLFLAGGLASRALAGSSALGAAGLGALQMGGQQFKEAEQALKALDRRIAVTKDQGLDATPLESQRDTLLKTKYVAMFAGMGLGATEAIPMERFFHRLNEVSNGRVASILANSAAQSLEEMLQEIGQTLGSNVVAKVLYEGGRDPFKGVTDSAAVAAVLGGLMGGAAGAISPRAPGASNATVPAVVTPEEVTRQALEAGPPDEAPPPPAPPAPVSPVAAPVSAPVTGVSAIERNTLRKQGYNDQQIDSMSPEERAAELGDAADQGVVADPLDFAEHGAPAEGAGTRQSPAKVNDPLDLDRAAAQANTEPTDPQKEAGNYQKGHLRWNGLNVTLENPKGSTRSGVSAEGEPWQVEMPAHYGYVKGTTGKDGDQVDVYLGDQVDSKQAFVVDQIDPATGKFDEHKVMLGFPDQETALAAYDAAFSDGTGPARRQAVTPLDTKELKSWLRSGETKQPLGQALAPDMPSAEPLSDIQAQARDLLDPNSPRQAVWLPPETVSHLRRTGGLKGVSGAGVRLMSFDKQGGMLIARDVATAKKATADRDAGVNLQEIIGRLTGDGVGKPAGADTVVQQQDAQGNVTRERLVTPGESPAVQAEFQAPGRTVAEIPAAAAIARREDAVEREQQVTQRTRARPRPSKDPISLLEFIASRGGLKPDADLKSMGLNARSSVVVPGMGYRSVLRGNGMTRDQLVEALQEGRYIPFEDETRPGDSGLHRQVLELIDEELRGRKQYAIGEADQTAAQQRADQDESDAMAEKAARNDLLDALDAIGFPPDSLDPKDISLTAEIMARDGLSAEDAFERAVMQNAMDDGVASEAEIDDNYGLGASYAVRSEPAPVDVEGAPDESPGRDRRGAQEDDAEGERVPRAGQTGGREAAETREPGAASALDFSDQGDEIVRAEDAEDVKSGDRADIGAEDSDETVTVSLSKDGPWDFNDTWPAPDAKAIAALEAEGRETVGTDPEGVVSVLDETLNAMMSDFATMRAAGRLLQKAKAGKTKPPGRRTAKDWIKELQSDVATARRGFMDTGASIADQFGEAATRAMKVEARRRVLQEERSSEQLDEADAIRLDRQREAQGVTERTEAGEQAAERNDIAALPPVPAGHIRLYRGEFSGSPKVLPDWLAQGRKEKGIDAAEGRWFTNSPELADWYVADAGGNGHMVYLDVPRDVVERSRVSLNEQVRSFSRDPENEFFLPASFKGKGKPVNPTTERTEAGEQAVIPGAEKIGQGEQAQRKADEPLKPKAPQRAADDGLFGDGDKQTDLLDLTQKAAKEPPFTVGQKVRRAPGSKLSQAIEGTVTHVRKVDGFDTFNIRVDNKGPYSASDFEAAAPTQVTEKTSAEDRAGPNGPTILGRPSYTDQTSALAAVKSGAIAQDDDKAGLCYKHAADAVIVEGGTYLIGIVATRGEPVYHAIVEETADGKTFYRDPTLKFDGWFEAGVFDKMVDGFTPVHRMMGGEVKRFGATNGTYPDPKTLGLPPIAEALKTTTQAPETGPSDSGTLADVFAAHLAKGEGFGNILAARKMAKEAGFDQDAKAVEEAMELALVRRGRDIVAGPGSVNAKYDALVNLYGRQPKLGTRTSTSMRDQAFSTPVPLAFLASRLAKISPDDKVMEPTAGNGALLMEVAPENALVNEINPQRAKNLEAQGFRPSSIDAAEKDLATGIINVENGVDVVIANPPFGALLDDTQSQVFDLSDIQTGYRTTQIDHAIALRSLAAMHGKGGRAVLILGGLNKQISTVKGRSNGYNAKAKREFYKVLYDRYNVVDHFTVAGELYERQGAGWPVDVIVIDGRGKSARKLPAVDVPRIYSTWDTLGDLLDADQRNGRETRVSDGAVDPVDDAERAREPDERVRPDSGGQRVRDRQSAPDLAARVQPGSVLDESGNAPAGRVGDLAERQSGKPGDAGGTGVEADAERRPQRVDEFDEAFDAALDETFGAQVAPKSSMDDRRGQPIIGTGTVVRTQSGRETSPAPKIDATSDRKVGNSVKRLDQWLLDEARKEVAGDSYRTTLLKGLDVNNFSQSDRDTVNQILFGDPDGPRPSDIINAGEQNRPSNGAASPDLLTADRATWEAAIWEAMQKGFASGRLDRKSQGAYRFNNGQISRYDGRKNGKERWFTLTSFELDPLAAQLGLPDALSRSKAGAENATPKQVAERIERERAENERELSDIAGSAATNIIESADLAMAGLVQLFGGGKTTAAGLGFDPETYAKAKPLFTQAAAKFEAFKDDVSELVRRMVGEMQRLHGLTREAMERMRPYLRRFVEDVQAGAIQIGTTEAAAPQKATSQEQETDRQVAYKPQSAGGYALGTLVPVNMRTSTSDALAALEERVGPIDAYVASELGYTAKEMPSYFAAEQIDALALSIENIKRGKGFIIGDQTGIGKGRVNAGIIRWAIKNDRIPVFFTEKPNLYGDMYRDLTDIGIQKMLGREPHVLATNADFSMPLSEDGKVAIKTSASKAHNAHLQSLNGDNFAKEYDMVFTNYSQAQTVQGRDTERRMFLSRIAEQSTIIFDESHNAGGNKKTAGFDYASKLASYQRKADKAAAKGQVFDEALPAKGAMDRAEFARDLVSRAKGVFYSSATYAKRPDVMDLYAATDMSMAVEKIENLGEAIAKGGVPMQQVVATMLAKAGQYIRRERSFAGIAYDTPVASVDRVQYDGISSALAAINEFSGRMKTSAEEMDEELKGAAKAMGHDNAVGDSGAKSMAFTSIMHNIINQMLLAMKARPAADLAIEALKRGEKPVITLANTMESFLTNFAEDTGLTSGSAINADFSDVLRRYLERTRTIIIKEPFKAGVERHYLTDLELGPDGLASYNQAKDIIDGLDLSQLAVSPIDMIKTYLNQAGYKVGEITGRGTIVDYSGPVPILKPRPGAETTIKGRRKAIADFNSGEIDAIIINQAGATGLSLHASEKFKDQRQRHMILAQPEANIDTHMQMLGRVHRTGQVIVPKYSQMVADIPAEKRPAAVLAKKMASLNANTTASRGGALTAKDTPDFMNEYGDMVAAAYVAEDPETNQRLGSPIKFSENGSLDIEDAMRKLTGRIPLLPLAQQEALYEHLESEYDALLKQMEASGENSLEAQTYDLQAITTESREVVAQKGDSASPFAAPVTVETVSVKRLGKPFPPVEVSQRIMDALGVSNTATKENAAALIDEHLNSVSYAKTSEMVKERKADFEAYKRALIDTLEKPERQESERVRLDGLWNKWSSIMELGQIGRPVVLKTSTGNITGFVVGTEHKGSTKNPIAPSSWKLSVVVADAARQVAIPFSRLYKAGDKVDDSNKFAIELSPMGWEETVAQVLERFERGQSDARETRFIATGNLLAAYDWLNRRGRIINYTDNEGHIRQGILTPTDFDVDEFKSEKRTALHSAGEVMGWLDANKGQDLWSDDNLVRLSKDRYRDKITITVAGARRDGGKFYLDRRLTDLTGDFFKKSGVMVAEAWKDHSSVVERLQNLGAVFTAPAPPSPPPGSKLSDQKSVASIRAPQFDARGSLTPGAQARRSDLEHLLGRVVQHLVGRNVEVRFSDTIPLRTGAGLGWGSQAAGVQTAAGAYLPAEAVIKLALRDPAYPGNPISTAFHEAFHAIENQLLTPDERALLERETPRLREFLNREVPSGLAGDPAGWADDIAGYEVRAIAFETYALRRTEAGSVGGMHIGARKVFEKIAEFVRRVKNALQGLGFRTAEDVFSDAYMGAMRDRSSRTRPGIEQANTRSVAFKEWFGDSKVVDKAGKPLKVFHGTDAQFASFDRSFLGTASDASDAMEGFWFSSSRERAQDAARDAMRMSGTNVPYLMEVYLRLHNPDIHPSVKEFVPEEVAALAQAARAKGKDGLIFTIGENGGSDYLVFQPAQIKSVDNAGSFNPTDERIHYNIRANLPATPQLDALPETVSEALAQGGTVKERFSAALDAALLRPARAIWDRQIDLLRFQRASEAAGGRVTESLDTYLAATLYPGRVGERMKDTVKALWEPLYEGMTARGVTRDELSGFLYARHATERNASIRDIDPDNDAGSGMTDAEAAQIIDRLSERRADFDALAAMADQIVAHNRRLMVRDGLESEATVQAWAGAYRHYVPLKGFESGTDDEFAGPSSGSGFDVRRPESRRALGRFNRADDVLANLLDQTQRTVIRAEKNRVAKTFLRFAQANPSPFWKIGLAEKRRRINPETGLVETYTVTASPDRDKVFAAKVGGETHYIEIKHEGLLLALKTLGADKINPFLRVLGRLTREFSRFQTAKNPEFVFTNIARDIQDAGFTVNGEMRDRYLKRYMANLLNGRALFGAVLGIAEKGEGTTYRQYFEEWRAAGGKISHYGLRDLDALKADVERELNQRAETTGKKIAMAIPRALNPINGTVVKFLEALSDVTETTTRLAVYISAREVGMTKAQAAAAARNATVDFNRRGKYGTAFGAMYAFANANIQGNVRLVRVLRKSKAARRAAIGIALAGMILTHWNMAMSPEDKEKKRAYEKRPYWERERNIIIYWPGSPTGIKIPLGYGLNVFWMMGEQAAMRMHGKVGTLEALGNVMGTITSAFNPLGSGGSFFDLATWGRNLFPTVLRPIPELGFNQNWLGRPIHPNAMPWNEGAPHSSQHKALTAPGAVAIAEAINRWTGGNKFEPGKIDVYPDDAEYAWNFAIGGLGKFLTNTHAAIKDYAEGAETPVERMPFVRRFVTSDNSAAVESEAYYAKRRDNISDTRRLRNAIKARTSGEDDGSADAVIERLAPKVGAVAGKRSGQISTAAETVFRNADKQLKAIRVQQDAIRKDDKLSRAEKKTQLDALRERMAETMSNARALRASQ